MLPSLVCNSTTSRPRGLMLQHTVWLDCPTPERSLQTSARTSHLHKGKEKALAPAFVPTEMSAAQAGR